MFSVLCLGEGVSLDGKEACTALTKVEIILSAERELKAGQLCFRPRSIVSSACFQRVDALAGGTQIRGNELIESSSELTVAECLKASCGWSAELQMQCWFISGLVAELLQASSGVLSGLSWSSCICDRLSRGGSGDVSRCACESASLCFHQR